MAKTSLAYIDGHIDRLLKSERNNPTPHQTHVLEATSPRKIAGFHVKDNAYSGRRLEEAKAKRRDIVEKYYALRAEIREEFQAIGVIPKAIIPTRTFIDLCTNAGMYFMPKSSKTGVNATHFLMWMQNQDFDSIAENEEQFRGRTFRNVKVRKRNADKTVAAYMASFPHEEVIRHLLDAEVGKIGLKHEHVGTEEKMVGDMGNVRKVTLRAFQSPIDGKTYELLLPEAPSDVVERLIKVADAGMVPQTVAVYGALDFLDGVSPILHEAIKQFERHEDEERERIDWMLHDPIVYLSRGPVTAVIDQFGPFPIEKALIDRVTATDFLPVNL